MPSSSGSGAEGEAHELRDVDYWKTVGGIIFFLNLMLAPVEICLAEGTADTAMAFAPASFASWRRVVWALENDVGIGECG